MWPETGRGRGLIVGAGGKVGEADGRSGGVGKEGTVGFMGRVGIGMGTKVAATVGGAGGAAVGVRAVNPG